MSGGEERLDALVADLDEAEVIDVIEDAMGDKVKVGRLRDAVLIGVQGSPGILDTPELRDRFAKAYAEACRRADGEPPAVEAAAGDASCQVPGSCQNGPGPHPFTPVAGDPLPGPCSRQPQEMVIIPAVLAAEGDDCGCGLGPERCAAAEDGD